MAILAGFSYGYVFTKFYKPNSPDLVQADFLGNQELYMWMVIGFICIVLLDFLISWTILKLFKKENPQLAFITSLLRFLYTVIFFRAIIFLKNNIELSNKHGLEINQNFEYFLYTWSIGLILFGIHLILLALILKKHQYIPKFIWYLMLIAGISYLATNSMKIFVPGKYDTANLLENILALPMVLGELCFAVWLIFKRKMTIKALTK